MKIRLAAQMQALAMALAQTTPFLTSATLVSHPEAKKLGACDHHAISALTVLHKIGKLSRFRMATGRAKYGYELPAGERKAAPPPPPPSPIPADVKVTVVGERLRIQFKGLVLDIGVE